MLALCRAHPHSRWENWKGFTRTSQMSGSSPLIRGKPRIGHDGRNLEGLIPAHARKTTPGRAALLSRWAHPRSREENGPLSPGVAVLVGSSQLMRGKLRFGSILPGDFGLIPAHAGKTCSQRCGCGRRRAHPRSRGENRAEKAHPAYQKGSSLLTQGKLDV